MSNRVNYQTEDGSPGPTWEMDGRPMVGDRVRRSGGEVWEVVFVQHEGTHSFRCICKPVSQD